MRQSSVGWFNKPFLWLHISLVLRTNVCLSSFTTPTLVVTQMLSQRGNDDKQLSFVCVQLSPVIKEQLLLVLFGRTAATQPVCAFF